MQDLFSCKYQYKADSSPRQAVGYPPLYIYDLHRAMLSRPMTKAEIIAIESMSKSRQEN